MDELLTPRQMAMADRHAIASGIDGIALMEAAGAAIAKVALEMWPGARRIAVLCGNGNNGGDGYVAARLLAEAGSTVRVYLVTGAPRDGSDARTAFRALPASLLSRRPFDPAGFDLVIDAIFGAGLDRPVTGEARELIDTLNSSGVPVLAADLPSGIDGENGAILGTAVKADASVTFFRLKPGHLLMPGREYCGKAVLAQIGIGDSALQSCGYDARENTPALWRNVMPFPSETNHKYSRGHAAAFSGGPWTTGAARLAAGAALRSGAGLVTLFSPPDALAVNAPALNAVMLAQTPEPDSLSGILDKRRINALVAGPGLEPSADTRKLVLAALASGRSMVLDAGALTAFANEPDTLFQSISSSNAPVIMTPHAGEFGRLFGWSGECNSKLEAARRAAGESSATLIFKGADTVIAAPDGRAAINRHAPPWLATAGSGDVLAGIAAGLLAQSMPSFEAACASVWLHGEAALRLGPGMTADDLDRGLHKALRAFHTPDGKR